MDQDHGRPVGPLVPSRPAVPPPRTALHGTYTSIVALQSSHAPTLFKYLGGESNAWRWVYMLGGGFTDQAAFQTFIDGCVSNPDIVYYTVLTGPASDPASEPAGMVGYLSIVPEMRRLEIGCVILGDVLVRTKQATEAFYLFMRHPIEDLGYLRVEWKANNFNKPSLSAALRLGFTFEGVFRSHMVIKGRRRDTAYFGITDEEWPVARDGFIKWLSASNFDEDGNQKLGLKECRESAQANGSS